MYTEYWGLSRAPFAELPTADCFYRSQTHQAALLKLRYAIEHSLGASLLLGEVGCGKTCVIEQLARELPARFRPVVRLVFPMLSAAELLSYLAAELGAPATPASASDGLDRTVRWIVERLSQHTREGRCPLIVIDEAQVIEDLRAFQTLQLLLNFQQTGRTEFSLLLAGDLTLAPRVGRLRQLDERIAVKSLIQRLNRQDSASYIAQRMTWAGAARPIFDDSALTALFELSGGLPRRINRLADLALLVAYADNLKTVTAEEIEAVADELRGVSAA
jgi:general secretion pathway protein A